MFIEVTEEGKRVLLSLAAIDGIEPNGESTAIIHMRGNLPHFVDEKYEDIKERLEQAKQVV